MGASENKQLVGDVFAAWAAGDGKAFFNLLADDVRWTVIGTGPISATYGSKKQFFDGATRPLAAKLRGLIIPKVTNLIADGDYVVAQWEGDATMTSGQPYHQTYCWVMRLLDGKVKEGTAYLDTELLADVFKSP